MINISSFLGLLGTLSILLVFYILARLSERFGSVIKMQPHFRYYYVALVFLLISWLTNLLVVLADVLPAALQDWLNSSWLLLLVYYLPWGIGVTIGLVVTWSYWSWLIAERNG